jgi:hypothetical protein
MSDAMDEGHTPRHKAHQHDVDLAEEVDEDDRILSLDEAYEGAMTPEEYVLSSPEAMASAIEQQAILDSEPS